MRYRLELCTQCFHGWAATGKAIDSNGRRADGTIIPKACLHCGADASRIIRRTPAMEDYLWGGHMGTNGYGAGNAMLKAADAAHEAVRETVRARLREMAAEAALPPALRHELAVSHRLNAEGHTT